MGKSRTRKIQRRADRSSAPAVRAPLNWKLVTVPVVVVALLITGGLLLHGRLSASPAQPVPATAANSGSATAFTVPTVNGPQFSLAAQRGHPVVLYFMAAWCTSCQAESNALGQIEQKYGTNVRIALVDIGGKIDSPGSLRDFVQRSQGPSRFWILDSQGTVAGDYGVTALDTTYVIDKNGHIAYSSATPLDYSTLDHVLGGLA